MTEGEWERFERPASPFAEMISDMVISHADHGGWYESPEGLRCQRDDEIVIPSPDFLLSDDA